MAEWDNAGELIEPVVVPVVLCTACAAIHETGGMVEMIFYRDQLTIERGVTRVERVVCDRQLWTGEGFARYQRMIAQWRNVTKRLAS